MKRLLYIPLLLIVLIVLASACGRSRMSLTTRPVRIAREIKTVAIAPGSGVLAEAIGLELFNAGMTVVEAGQAAQIVGRFGLKEFEVTTTRGYEALQEKGIDAVLVAKSVIGYDGKPQSASVRVSDTLTGQIIAGLTWQNAWGGARGSPADAVMRKDLSTAARQIARALLKQLRASR